MSKQNQTISKQLAKCPFCGGEAVLHTIEPHKHVIVKYMPDYGGGAFVECTSCTCAISEETTEEAIKAWNTRKPMERILKRLEEEKEKALELWDNNSRYKGYNHAIEILKEEGEIK